jgi:O-antigen/teichoic acid export membrane protein
LGGIVWPVLAVASLSSLPAIRLFFGEQWDAAAPLAGWLAFWSAFRSVHWFSNDMLMASHREKVMVVKEIIVFGVLLIGVIAAYPAGLERIAQVFLAVALFEVTFITMILKAYAGLNILAFLRAWLPNILAAAICGGLTLAIRQWLDFNSDPPWKVILVLAVIMPPTWLISLKILHHPLYYEVRGLISGVRTRLG